MKHGSLTAIFVGMATRALSLTFSNFTTGVGVTTPAIAVPSSLVTSPNRTSSSEHSFPSPPVDAPFDGPGIDANLSSYCVASQSSAKSSAYSRYLERTTTPQPVTQTLTNLLSEIYTYTSSFKFHYQPTYQSPCCGACTAWAAKAEVFYWPTPNPQPNITTIVDSTGFTYTSPSVYVTYRSLQADNRCGWGVVGTMVNRTTLSFQPTELSTIRKTLGMNWNIGTYQLDFRDWGTSCTLTFSTATASDGVVGVWNPCAAILAIPSKVLDLQPAWSTCAPGVGATGVHDPPFALIPAAGGITPITIPQTTMFSPALPSAAPESIPSITSASARQKITSAQTAPTQSSIASADLPSSSNSIPLSELMGPFSSSPFKPSDSSPSAAIQIPAQLTDANYQVTQMVISTSGPPGLVNLPTPTTVAIGGHPLAIPSIGASVVSVGSAIISINGLPATVSDIAISLGSSVLIVGTSTVTLAGTDLQPTTSPLSFDGITASIVPAGVAFGTQTVTTSQAIIVSGITVSLGLGAPVIASNTIPFTKAPVLTTVAGQPSTVAGSLGILTVAGSIVTPGGPRVTISGIPVSLDRSGLLIIGTSTIVPPVNAITTQFVIGSNTFTIDPTNIIIEGFTLAPGSPGVSVNGILVSLGSTDLVVGTQTETFSPVGTSSLGGLGAIIMSGLGAIGGSTIISNSSSTTTGISPFLGAATKGFSRRSMRTSITMLAVWILCYIYIS